MKENGLELIEPKPDDTYLLSYTSGTTGDPKGVKLTHKMILNAAQGMNTRFKETKDGTLGPDDVYLSYLSQSHSFEQVMQASSLIYGMRCGFYTGNIL